MKERNLKDIYETAPTTKEEFIRKLKKDIEFLSILGTSNYSKTKAREILYEITQAEKKHII